MKRLSRTTSVLGIAILFGLIFWILDGLVNYFFFSTLFRFMLFEKPNDLLEAVVTNIPPHALFVRLFVLTAFIVGGLLVAAVMRAQRRTERDRVRLLLQVQEQARRIQGILDTIPEGLILLDGQRQVLMTNPVAERDLPVLVGPRTEAPLTYLGDRRLNELLTSPPKGLWHEVVAGSRSFEVIARPLEDGPGSEGWVLVMRDVTQEREIQRRIQLQERLAAVGQLAAGIAHDFNNIMATIVLYAQLSLRIEALTPHEHDRLETIYRQAMHATNLIQQILDFSRQAVIERRPLNLVPLLKEQVKLLERTLPEDIKIEFTHDQPKYMVNADPTRIQQVVMNLAVNARDAMPGGGQLCISLQQAQLEEGASRSSETEAGEWVQLAVSDTGTGIPADVLPHIYDPFFTTKPPGQGSGLGLAQVYGIVKQHDGYVHVTSQEGEGATFTVELPALLESQSEMLALDTGPLPQGNGETILVVEDDTAAREALVDGLDLLNYQVVAVEDGHKALKVLAHEEASVSLVLSDVVMPEMGGLALARAMQERGWEIPVVLMTGHPLNRTLESLQGPEVPALVKDLLRKPLGLERLADVVARRIVSNRDESR